VVTLSNPSNWSVYLPSMDTSYYSRIVYRYDPPGFGIRHLKCAKLQPYCKQRISFSFYYYPWSKKIHIRTYINYPPPWSSNSIEKTAMYPFPSTMKTVSAIWSYTQPPRFMKFSNKLLTEICVKSPELPTKYALCFVAHTVNYNSCPLKKISNISYKKYCLRIMSLPSIILLIIHFFHIFFTKILLLFI
jgi:hypothetical protein